MASSGNSGQIRNSSSPSVVALGSNKASSVATAKPRFRSRTGCWTCRRRKVKCDERGRNPESVAYGGPLNTNAGCKRCEDSGRPCHGYGAQAPSAPLLNQYPVTNIPGESFMGSNQFFSQPHHTLDHKNIGQPQDFSSYVGGVEPPSLAIQWSQSYAHAPNQTTPAQIGSVQSYSRQGSCSTATSSAPTLSTSAISNSSHEAAMLLPSIDLRRYSVPNYPTWKSEPQQRSYDHNLQGAAVQHPSALIRHNSLDFDGLAANNSLLQQTASLLNSGQSLKNQGTTYRSLKSSNYDELNYNQTSQASSRPSLQYSFDRPRTSSGAILPYSSQSYHQNLEKPFDKSISNSYSNLERIGESGYTTPIVSPETTVQRSDDQNHSIWSDSQIIPGFSHTSTTIDVGNPFRSIATSIRSLPSNISRDSSEIIENDKLMAEKSTTFNHICDEDSLKYSAHEIPTRMYISTPEIPTSEGDPSKAQLSMPLKGNSLHSNFQSLDSSQNYSMITKRDPAAIIDNMCITSYNGLEATLPSNLPQHPTTSPSIGLNKGTVRKDSSSSCASSFSTHETGASPLVSAMRRTSEHQICSETPSLSASPRNSRNQFLPVSVGAQVPPSFSSFESPITMLNCHNSSGSFDKWNSSLMNNQQIDYQQYDFHPIIYQPDSEIKCNEAFDDDSPTSTTNSNFSATGSSSQSK
ncbi:expressed protein [Phakopsora pachyrhizi]|uniref:Expressed protein n=1 Tax=Phakopsora pachyrhizi TaxID=170000 RepID=A0AAV0B6X4_PHAPC|nr:expressed protein [Phakopsora pachyrhizi]